MCVSVGDYENETSQRVHFREERAAANSSSCCLPTAELSEEVFAMGEVMLLGEDTAGNIGDKVR